MFYLVFESASSNWNKRFQWKNWKKKICWNNDLISQNIQSFFSNKKPKNRRLNMTNRPKMAFNVAQTIIMIASFLSFNRFNNQLILRFFRFPLTCGPCAKEIHIVHASSSSFPQWNFECSIKLDISFQCECAAICLR